MMQKEDTLTQLFREQQLAITPQIDNPKIKRLEQAQNRTEKQIILAKQRGRTRGNRVKFLVGAAVLNKMQNDEAFCERILSVLDVGTTRTKDRVFLNEYGGFNLPVDEKTDK